MATEAVSFGNVASPGSNKRDSVIFASMRGCNSSVVLSAPTIQWPWVGIPSTSSNVFSIFIVEIEAVFVIGM